LQALLRVHDVKQQSSIASFCANRLLRNSPGLAIFLAVSASSFLYCSRPIWVELRAAVVVLSCAPIMELGAKAHAAPTVAAAMTELKATMMLSREGELLLLVFAEGRLKTHTNKTHVYFDRENGVVSSDPSILCAIKFCPGASQLAQETRAI
jgi:hypothetical protein